MTTEENTSSIVRPCGGCIFLGRKCESDCIFAPLFPQKDAKKFENLAKVYGAANVSELLVTIPESDRKNVVKSLHVETTKDRIKDPVYARRVLAAYSAQLISTNQDLDHLSSDTVMPDNSQPMIGSSAGVASVHGSPQPQQRAKYKGQVASATHEGKLVIGNCPPPPLANKSHLMIGHGSRQSQQPRQMAKDKGKKVASAADKGKLVIGNRPELLPDKRQSMIGESAGVASEHSPPRPKRPRKMAKDKGKQVASTAHKGKLVIGNCPQLQPDNSRSMIGVSTGVAYEHSPPQPKRQRKMAKYKGKQITSDAHEGKLVIGNRPQLLPDNTQPMIGVPVGVASVHSPPQPQKLQQNDKDKGKKVASAAHKGKLMIGNRPQLLPGQLQVRQMAPIASPNRGQWIIRDPQTHEYLVDQQQMARISSADTSQMLFRQPQPHLRTANQQQMAQISSADIHGYHEDLRIADQQQLGRISSMDQVLWAGMDQMSWADMHQLLRNADQQQLRQISSVNTGQMLIKEPQPDGYMRINDQQQQMAQMSSQQHGFTRITDQQHLGRMPIMEPQWDGYVRIDDQLQMPLSSFADTGPLLNREPQQHEFTRFDMPPTLGSLENVPYDENSLLQSQQLMQQKQQLYVPPDYQDTEVSRQMALAGQQNQQLQLHSDILSSDHPHLRSQMMPQAQQDQQSHSQEQCSQPVLDQQPSDKGKSIYPTQLG